MAVTPIDETKKKRGKLELAIPVVLLVSGIGGASYAFVIAPKQAAAEAAAASTTTQLELGKIVRLAPITTNLSDGHVLKVGLALQMVAEPKEEELNLLVGTKAASEGGAEGGGSEPAAATMTLGGLESKALDVTISELGGNTYAVLSSSAGRAHAKEQLAERIKEAYEGDVVEVYFTDFVMS